MRKTYSLAYLSILTLVSLFVGCKKSVPPVSERIAKVWTASQVDESSTTVYRRGATANIRNYASFKLDLNPQFTVNYTDWDGIPISGKWSLPDDNTLELTSLMPTPTGVTNSTIRFTINSIDDNNLKLTRQSTSQKTGGTTNVYTLTNP